VWVRIDNSSDDMNREEPVLCDGRQERGNEGNRQPGVDHTSLDQKGGRIRGRGTLTLTLALSGEGDELFDDCSDGLKIKREQ
jgi:hypothetical protein